MEQSSTIENSRNSGKITGISKIAGICITNNSRIVNCTNEAAIYKKENITLTDIKIAGICAENSGVIENTKNNADIISNNTGNQTIKIGTICSSNYKSGIIEKSENTAKIISEGKDINVTNEENTNIQGCTNTGTGEIKKTDKGTIFVGIICGKMEEE